jgi:hypothetical protein
VEPGVDFRVDLFVVDQVSTLRRVQTLFHHRSKAALTGKVGLHCFIQQIGAVAVHGLSKGVKLVDCL